MKYKSKVLSFGFFFSICSLLFSISAIVWLLCMIILHHGFKDSIGEGTSLIGVLWFLFIMVLCASIFGRLLWDSHILEIDTEKRVIKFTNRFTRVSNFFSFSYFENSVIIFEPISGGYARNYYFLKDGKAVKRICGFIYSNQEELETALEEIKSLGNIKYSYLNSARILFNKRISLKP